MNEGSALSGGDSPKPLRVSRLIAAASQHLATRGDTIVKVAISTADEQLDRLANAIGAQYDESKETWIFEIEARPT